MFFTEAKGTFCHCAQPQFWFVEQWLFSCENSICLRLSMLQERLKNEEKECGFRWTIVIALHQPNFHHQHQTGVPWYPFWFQISKTSKELLDSVGGFRCEHRGIMDLPVRILIIVFSFVFKYECVKVFLFGGAYLGLLNTNFTFYLQNHPPIETYWLIGPDR